MRRITISLPEDLDDLLRDEARRRNRSVSEVVRRVVARSLLGTEEEPREIPFAGIMNDPDMVQSDEIEELLEETWTDAIHRHRR